VQLLTTTDADAEASFGFLFYYASAATATTVFLVETADVTTAATTVVVS